MSFPKTAMICGVSGQDGAYLAQFLDKKGYRVFGTSRDAQMNTFHNLQKLGILSRVKTLSMSSTDFRSVYQALVQIQPDEIYNLSGQSSVGLSFDQPLETFESINTGTINLLEVIRMIEKPIRFYNASSSECFGDTGDIPADETTPFHPRSPYAVAKASAHWIVANYREAYGLFACNGILFNHDSPLRPERFVTKKIVKAACDIARGKTGKLFLGNIHIQRDWGWAPEYIQAMWLMMQKEKPDDYVIATGESRYLAEFAETAFAILNLNWKDHTQIDPSLSRATDISVGCANPRKAKEILGWSAKFKMEDVVKKMIDAIFDDEEMPVCSKGAVMERQVTDLKNKNGLHRK